MQEHSFTDLASNGNTEEVTLLITSPPRQERPPPAPVFPLDSDFLSDSDLLVPERLGPLDEFGEFGDDGTGGFGVAAAILVPSIVGGVIIIVI
eukprot:710331-Prorocentrum_minimum.AAC.2